jgi:hypothetical protein
VCHAAQAHFKHFSGVGHPITSRFFFAGALLEVTGAYYALIFSLDSPCYECVSAAVWPAAPPPDAHSGWEPPAQQEEEAATLPVPHGRLQRRAPSRPRRARRRSAPRRSRRQTPPTEASAAQPSSPPRRSGHWGPGTSRRCLRRGSALTRGQPSSGVDEERSHRLHARGVHCQPQDVDWRRRWAARRLD